MFQNQRDFAAESQIQFVNVGHIRSTYCQLPFLCLLACFPPEKPHVTPVSLSDVTWGSLFFLSNSGFNSAEGAYEIAWDVMLAVRCMERAQHAASQIG